VEILGTKKIIAVGTQLCP